ncbi:MAG: VTT domain-containing protein [Candidatus Paceibacterota bacterium]|jgi:membrane-associated protein
MTEILHALEPKMLIETFGLIGIFCIVFAESGLFFGFFFPGDSLLFTAGFLASQNYLGLDLLLIGSFVCAVLGDNTGYWFGKKVGPKIFNKEDSVFFHKDHVKKAQDFYDKYGNKTIILARFVPVVRTFAPIVAGVGNMKYRNFLTYNIIGGFLWSFLLILSGYYLGTIIPGADKYLLPIVLVIIVLSVLPGVFEIVRKNRHLV